MPASGVARYVDELGRGVLAPQPAHGAAGAGGEAGGLDHRRRERPPGEPARCPSTAPLIASAEPSTRSKRSRSARAVSIASRASSVLVAQLGEQRPRLARSDSTSSAQRLERVEHPHQHDDQRGEPDRAQQRRQRDGELTRAHRSSLASMPVAVHAVCDLLFEPVVDSARYQRRSAAASGRYCCATQPPSWS